MIQLENIITKLIDKRHAYASKEGNVYFRVSSFPEYGKLSHQQIDENMIGVRIDVEPGKEDDRDFALWKTAGEDEIFWDSPWGMEITELLWNITKLHMMIMLKRWFNLQMT